MPNWQIYMRMKVKKMAQIKNLIVGAGLSGATLARKLAENGEHVILIEKQDHIAGNVYDYLDRNKIMIHKYGSHIFHTNLEQVWAFVNRFGSFNTYMHQVKALIDGKETNIPFNLKTLYDVFPKTLAEKLETKLLEKFEYNKKIPILEFCNQEDPSLKFLADYIYEKVFLHYTAKQWGMDPASLAGAVTARVPVYLSLDPRYFQDKYQGIPLKGYTVLVSNMINHKNIELHLNTSFKTKAYTYDRLFYTGAIDEFFDYKYGALPYRSVYFKLEEHAVEHYQSNAVVNYPCNYDFTRIHEYKYYLNNQSPNTVIAKEYSENFEIGQNERYYPVPNEKNEKLYQRYIKEAQKLQNVWFLGRLGDYKYYDMDKAIQRALTLSEKILHAS